MYSFFINNFLLIHICQTYRYLRDFIFFFCVFYVVLLCITMYYFVALLKPFWALCL